MRFRNQMKTTFAMSILLSGALLVLFWCKDVELSKTLSRATKITVHNKICHLNHNDERMHVDNETELKMIYYVTPTYPRPEQIPDLTRLSHTLMHVPRIHWIVAEDYPECSDRVLNILKKSGLPFTYISSPKPYHYTGSIFPRGVANRRAALAWLHENASTGVLYFGDDDNTVDLELFDEMRRTKRVSMFPVGLIGHYGVSAPIVSDGKVQAFFDSWPGDRMYPIDMAGFAVNLEFLKPSALMPYEEGQEENKFLISLGLKVDDIEPLADNCSKVLVWHTRTEKNKVQTIKIDLKKLQNQPKLKDFVNLLEEVSSTNMVHLNPTTGKTPYYIIRGKQRKHKDMVSLADLK
ncbi:hypothetical protein O0L34_g2781 [Tuta absoluta]|nr:hypothetical protein O0L34_g2781 [Tuta absoluta]